MALHRSAYGRLRSLTFAWRCLLRASRLLLAERPRTPLRVLCIAAFDLLHRLRRQQDLSSEKQLALAIVLDYGAFANACFDQKSSTRASDPAVCERLNELGLRELADAYWQRLKDIETHRPLPFGPAENFIRVQQYREAGAELALGFLAATVFEEVSLDAGVTAVRNDDGLQLLFRIAMQCQILDDLFDESQDQRLGLPSFLTATTTCTHFLVRAAADAYGDLAARTEQWPYFSLQLSLWLLTKLVSGLTYFFSAPKNLFAGASPSSVVPTFVIDRDRQWR